MATGDPNLGVSASPDTKIGAQGRVKNAQAHPPVLNYPKGLQEQSRRSPPLPRQGEHPVSRHRPTAPLAWHRTPSLAPHPATTVSGEGSRRSAARLGAALPARRPPAAGPPRARALAAVPAARVSPLPRRPLLPPRRAAPRLAPASPQAGLARRVAAGLGTATSKPLPAARPRRRAQTSGRAPGGARAQTPAGRGGAEAAPAARRGARAGCASSFFLLFCPFPVLFVGSFPSSRSKMLTLWLN